MQKSILSSFYNNLKIGIRKMWTGIKKVVNALVEFAKEHHRIMMNAYRFDFSKYEKEKQAEKNNEKAIVPVVNALQKRHQRSLNFTKSAKAVNKNISFDAQKLMKSKENSKGMDMAV